MSLVQRIKELCKKEGLSLQSLEAKIGLGTNTIYKWDKAYPSADKLKKVSDYFGVSTDYLMDGQTPASEVEAMLEYLHKNPEMKVLLSSSAKLTKEDLDAVVNIVKRMKGEQDFE